MAPFAVLVSLLAFLPFSAAVRMLEAKSLNPCMENSKFTATLFSVVFTPDNRTVTFNINGISSISGNVTAELEVIAYGYTAVRQSLNPCKMNLEGMCPMNTGQINLPGNIPDISPDVVNQVPGIAYTVPDLDGTVKIYINSTDTNTPLACVEAQMSNGKTVDQKAVGWATAVIAGLALLASAVTNGLGHSNTAAHVAANALSLFGYFQAQAFIGMTAVTLPPIVQSWTQNFQWSMGIIRIGFLQAIARWYQRSTGGTPSTLLATLSTTSVEVQKRADEYLSRMLHIFPRSSSSSAGSQVKVVRGIERVGFRAGIERTNIFFTGLAFFVIFVVFVAILIAIFKGFCELAVRAKWMKSDKFQEFRNGWLTVLKGILFRLVLIGYPQMCVLCLWELTERDSAAEVVLGIFMFLSMTFTLVWAALKVIRIATRSVSMHKNPAYILYSDPKALNKWGFLYVQFRATAYYFILPVLGYVLIKSMFIAFGQGSGTVQAVALVVIEGVLLIVLSILRPYMDRKTNAFNISIGAINFLNAIFLLVFSGIFNQPLIVSGVMGVVFFVYNAVFALVLLLLVLVATCFAIFSKNPDTRYQPMRDDRGSFIKSNPQMTTELDALGVTARGEPGQLYKPRDIDDDDSWSSESMNKQQHDPAVVPLPPSTSHSNGSYRDGRSPVSPVETSLPLFPSDASPRHGPPTTHTDNSSRSYLASPYDRPTTSRSNNASPVGRNHDYYGQQPTGYRQQTGSPSPWQRGAGYEH
ncbi:TRP-domain-containing protein [Xylona heveae TC161]|uniref:TRP-domain-containing protein n=1 Tax=Xylona heveae (strain CBS 132557 / TC161) TaxID=1328760 RepID=A0A164ZDL8_XYLHT|nr:TRP-domain-containing protein [Xylona heveae TC161]KZF18967.1 TRP-domain-containing protein [Xylona heveae TC161]